MIQFVYLYFNNHFLTIFMNASMKIFVLKRDRNLGITALDCRDLEQTELQRTRLILDVDLAYTVEEENFVLGP